MVCGSTTILFSVIEFPKYTVRFTATHRAQRPDLVLSPRATHPSRDPVPSGRPSRASCLKRPAMCRTRPHDRAVRCWAPGPSPVPNVACKSAVRHCPHGHGVPTDSRIDPPQAPQRPEPQIAQWPLAGLIAVGKADQRHAAHDITCLARNGRHEYVVLEEDLSNWPLR